jgi:hypothetical protein
MNYSNLLLSVHNYLYHLFNGLLYFEFLVQKTALKPKHFFTEKIDSTIFFPETENYERSSIRDEFVKRPNNFFSESQKIGFKD